MEKALYIYNIISIINEYIKYNNNLLICNKYFKELKLKYYNFNKKFSYKYYEDIQFREFIQLNIPNNKLSLYLSNKTMLKYSFKELGINNYKKSSILNKLDLNFYNKITDLSIFIGIHSLNLSFCSYITDISMLKGLHTLILKFCNGITDVSMLGELHTLDIESCVKITDVSKLGKLNTLNIKYCYRITDISMLNNIKNLIK